MSNEFLASALYKHYGISAEPIPYGSGNINSTFLVCSDEKYLLQVINQNVFKSPENVMKNIIAVTEHLRKKILECGGNPERETLTVIKTLDGKYFAYEDDKVIRLYKYIDDTLNFDIVDSPVHFYNAACAFGRFQMMMADFPVAQLYETIPFFHDTKKRYNDLKDAILKDPLNRAKTVKDEIEFFEEREHLYGLIVEGLHDGSIPQRITHNDTKINNVLLDKKTGKGLCVIDLDTVMPGSMLYDFGDAIRSGANTASENEKDLSKVSLDLNLFESFTKGFLSETKDCITNREADLLATSAEIITLELAMRFLTDYILGDVYFKIKGEHHNLERARVQMTLAKDIEKKLPLLNEIVRRILAK